MALCACFFLFLLALLPPALGGFYEKNDAIVQLTIDNFDAEVFGTEHAWIVEFYAPWCGHCQRLVPEYEKAAENLKGLVKVGSVDCDDQKNQPICGRYQIQGFPTLKVFPGSAKAKPSGKFSKEPKDYQGPRTARAIADAGLAEIPNLSVKLTSKATSSRHKNIDEFLSSTPEAPKAILFTTKAVTTPLFKALSVDLNSRMILGEVQDKEKDIVSRFQIEKFPTLIVIPDGTKTESFVTYDGTLQHGKLIQFLEKYALPPSKKAKKEQAKEPVQEVFNPEIVQVKTQKEFKAECLDRPIGMCLVSFMILEPEFEESVAAHREQIQVLKAVKKNLHEKKMPISVIWVDAIQERKLLDTFNLSDQFPSLLILSPNKKVYRPFTGGFEEASVMEFLEETSKAKGRFFKFDFTPTLSVDE